MTPVTPRTDDLIQTLTENLVPVRRLAPPLLRALQWLGAVGLVAAGLALTADLPAVAARLGAVPDMWLSVLGSALTAVLGAVAAFELSLPDRRSAWALLPLPSLALWLGAGGLGCLREGLVPGTHVAPMHEAMDCFAFIVGLSVPLSVLLVLMVRRGFPLRPGLSTVVIGLTAAAASATLLMLRHPFDAGLADLASHVVAVAVVVLANRLLGGRLLTRG